MVRGLALAETTPGPLIMVVQFVAFVGAYRDPGALDPWVAAVLAALLTTWVTFVPCFVFIFLGAPYVERLRGNQAPVRRADRHHRRRRRRDRQPGRLLRAAHAVRRDHRAVAWGPLDLEVPGARLAASWLPLAIAVVAGLLLFRLKWSVLRTLGVCALLGLAAALAVIVAA